MNMLKNKEQLEREIKKSKLWIVYMHINKINDKKYIGITCQNPKRRWSNGNGYSGCTHFENAIKKYGWDNFEHIILLENLTKKEAINKEKELIFKYNTTNANFGYNLSLGGDGINIPERWEGWCKKISESRIGNNNPVATPIVQLDKNYNIIKEYEYMSLAEDELNIHIQNISQCCRGVNKSAGGFIFMYKTDYESKKVELVNKSANIVAYRKPVIQLDLNGNEIKKFNSIAHASKTLKIDESSIGNVCKGRRQVTAGGFKWKYA